MALTEVQLSDLRTRARQLSDMENTSFVSDTELNYYINMGIQELYDLLLEAHGQEFFLKTFEVQVTSPINTYEIPDDVAAIKGVDFRRSTFPSLVEDLGGGNTITHNVVREQVNDVIELIPYTFADRHRATTFPLLRTCGTNMRYRMFTQEVTLAPEPAGDSTPARNYIRLEPVTSGYILVWYVPHPPTLSADSDSLPLWDGFEHYPALFAAKAALDKEESDSGPVMQMMERMRDRIYRIAERRDAGHAERVQDVYEHDNFWSY